VKTAFCLRRLENGERSSSTTEMKQATTAGRDSLVVAAAKAEEVAEFVVAVTEAFCRDEALQPPHASGASFDAAVILLKPVIMEWPAPHALRR
jgi:hypothetical protein